MKKYFIVPGIFANVYDLVWTTDARNVHAGVKMQPLADMRRDMYGHTARRGMILTMPICILIAPALLWSKSRASKPL